MELDKISPRDIYQALNETVIGQDDVKKLVSTALFQHMVNIRHQEQYGSIIPNMRPVPLIMGESGNGKTFIIREAIKAVRKLLNNPDIFPLVEIDCTQLSPAGFVGQGFAEIVLGSVAQIKNRRLLDTTIVYLDEIDKVCTPMITSSGDDWHKEIQYSLLKLIEGGSQRMERRETVIDIDTTPWLFILSGNFPMVRKKRDDVKDKETKPPMGFTKQEDKAFDLDAELHTKKILQSKEVGMVTQLCGRITNISSVNRLTDAELRQICKRNIIPDITKFFNFVGSYPHIPDSSIDKVIERCNKLKLGARGLRGEFEGLIQSLMFDLELNLREPNMVSISHSPVNAIGELKKDDPIKTREDEIYTDFDGDELSEEELRNSLKIEIDFDEEITDEKFEDVLDRIHEFLKELEEYEKDPDNMTDKEDDEDGK